MIHIHKLLDLVVPVNLPGRVLCQPFSIGLVGLLVIEVGIDGVVAVVGDAGVDSGGIGLMGGLEPGVTCSQVLGDAKVQAFLLGCLLPQSNYVLLRAFVHGVPLVQFGIPEEEVVVVGTHTYKVLGAYPLIKLHQRFRVPALGFPQFHDVLVSELGRMAVGGHVVLVLP